MVLDKDQVQAIRDRWNEQVKGIHQGGTPILTAGLKVVPWSTPAKDAQLAELSRLSAEKICWAFGIPLQLLGLANTPATSTEALMHFWLATGLGFCLNHVEQSFEPFRLEGEPESYTEFSTDALLRTAQKDRIEALVRGVQGGVFAPNEARAQEDLPAVPFGDEPRVQAQVIPLSAAGSIPTAPVPDVPPAAPASAKTYRANVQSDLEALRAHARRPDKASSRELPKGGYIPPPPGVIRKVKRDALQR
jgi:hypothetical protein